MVIKTREKGITGNQNIDFEELSASGFNSRFHKKLNDSLVKIFQLQSILTNAFKKRNDRINSHKKKPRKKSGAC
jgi:hypothetical protein